MHVKSRSHSIGPVVASRVVVPLLRIERVTEQTSAFTVSGRLDAEIVSELCQLIDAQPAAVSLVLDLRDLVLADREAIHYLRDWENNARVVLRNCPAYIRAWMAGEAL